MKKFLIIILIPILVAQAQNKSETSSDNPANALHFSCGAEPQIPQCVCGHNPGIYDAVDGQHNNRLQLWYNCKANESQKKTCGNLVKAGTTLAFKTFLQSKVANSGTLILAGANIKKIAGQKVSYFIANSKDKTGKSDIYRLSVFENTIVLANKEGDLWMGRCQSEGENKIIGQGITFEGKVFPFEISGGAN